MSQAMVDHLLVIKLKSLHVKLMDSGEHIRRSLTNISVIMIMIIMFMIKNLHDDLSVLWHCERRAVSDKNWFVARAERQVRVEVTLHQDHLIVTMIMILMFFCER